MRIKFALLGITLFSLTAGAGTKINFRLDSGYVSKLESNLPKELADGTFQQDFFTSDDTAFVRAKEFLDAFQSFLDDCGVNVTTSTLFTGNGSGSVTSGLLFQKKIGSKDDFNASKKKGIIEIKEYIELRGFARLVKLETGEEYWRTEKKKDNYGNTFQVEAFVDAGKKPVWFRLESKNVVAKDPLRAVLLLGSKWKKTCISKNLDH